MLPVFNRHTAFLSYTVGLHQAFIGDLCIIEKIRYFYTLTDALILELDHLFIVVGTTKCKVKRNVVIIRLSKRESRVFALLSICR